MAGSDRYPRFRERVGGRVADVGDAHTGSPVVDVDGVPVGTVAGMQGKYIEVDDHDGRRYWLTVSVVERVMEGRLQLEFSRGVIDDFILNDEEMAAGLDAPSPAMAATLDQLSSEAAKECRREGLVRDDGGE